VYTQGVAGRPEHLLHDNGIDVVRIDRGGQITYHGPGQIIAYLLLDMRRYNLGVRELVRRMEGSVIDLLKDYQISAEGRTDAPGVYVNGAKIAALGLKIKNGCCYHGLSLNVNMELTPFSMINPCGYPGLKVTQTRSEIGGKQNQRDTLRSLGLKRIGDVVVKEDRPEIRGMVNVVSHLVKVEEVD
jgi:lipoyl(octanoyl) transferase